MLKKIWFSAQRYELEQQAEQQNIQANDPEYQKKDKNLQTALNLLVQIVGRVSETLVLVHSGCSNTYFVQGQMQQMLEEDDKHVVQKIAGKQKGSRRPNASRSLPPAALRRGR